MQFKNKLLSGVVASAAIFGMVGTAHAVDINVNVSGIALGDTSGQTLPVQDPLPFANEVASSDGSGSTSTNTRDNGVATVGFDVSTGTFPSGNIIMQLQLNGGTFRGALSGATAFNFSGCNDTAPNEATANVSIGGANGGNTVTFLISNLNDCGNGDNPTVAIPFDINSPTSDVSLVMTIFTESGTVPVDAVPANGLTIPLVEMVSAFDVVIDDENFADVIADVEAVDGPYLDFTNPGENDLGSIDLEMDTSVYVDLAGAGPATTAVIGNILAADVTITGSFAPFRQANGGDSELGGDNMTVNTAGTSAGIRFDTTVTAPEQPIADIVNSGGLDFEVTPDLETPIQKSNYNASVNVDLAAGFIDFTAAGPLAPITRNGSSAILPWTASNTQAGGTGSNNFVRVSNPTTLAYGPIFATVLAASSNGSTTVGTTATLAPSLAAGAEVVFTAAQLETLLGNFGRADIEISVEGVDAIIARLVQRTDGTYEINNR
jgi:hypothetical protein